MPQNVTIRKAGPPAMPATATAVGVLSTAASGSPIAIASQPGDLTAEGVSGSIAPDSQITINTLTSENFGTSSIQFWLYEDFRGQADGATPSLATTDGDNWNDVSGGEIDTAEFKLGDASWLRPTLQIIRNTFGAQTGFRCSYWIRSSLSDGEISAGRGKLSWVFDGPNGFLGNDDFDYCFPTKMNSVANGWGLAGNDDNRLTNLNPWVPANEWVRSMFSFDPVNGWRFLRIGPTFGLQLNEDTDNLFNRFPNSTTVDRVSFGSTTDHLIRYDGFMIHRGEGANACVEIGNSELYDDCTELFDSQIVSWSSGQLSCILRVPTSISLAGWYIHIHRPDRAHVDSGRLGRLIQ